jgi:TetR/AcrR family transcriptional regulator, regulator of mycofactocin system
MAASSSAHPTADHTADQSRGPRTVAPAEGDATVPAVRRRGRPPGTSPRALETIALRLFSEIGFDDTTVDDIATTAGVSARTFFRYFESKAEVVWAEFDGEVAQLRQRFAAVPDEVPLMEAIRGVVVSLNHHRSDDDVPDLRARMHLLTSVPALQASAAPHYDAWERAVSEFAGRRMGQPPDALLPLAVGRSTLASCRAAFDLWLRRADADLTRCIDEALQGLAHGFSAIDRDGTSAAPAATGG